MGDHQQVPAIVQTVASVADDVAVGPVFAREKVARPRIMAEVEEGVTDRAAILARNQDPQGADSPLGSGETRSVIESKMRLPAAPVGGSEP